MAQALTRVLLTLDCRLTVVDPRAEWLERLPHDPLLTRLCAAAPDEHVAAVPQAGYVVVMTQGHATDVPVLRAALQRPFPYVGVLGSAVKAQRLRRELLDAGLPADRVAALRCPMGLPLGRSTPPEIAISVAAQLITARDAGRTPRQSARPDAP